MMWIYPVVTLILMVSLFAYVGVRSFLYGSRDGMPTNARRLSLALGWVCLAFVAIAIQGSAHQAVRRGWISSEVQDWVFSWGVSILATFCLIVGAVCLWLVSKVFARVRYDEHLVSVMIQSPVVGVNTSELGLTARELEVLEAMADGHLSDEEIAAAFFISPATAATHVRNILRKAGVHNRRDLVLMYAAARPGSGREEGLGASPT